MSAAAEAQPQTSPATKGEFLAHFDAPTLEGGVFNGNLIELAALLRAQKLPPVEVPLLQLTRQVLLRFKALRLEFVGDIDAASEALPQLASVIELKARLLLPRPPKTETEEDPDAALEEVLEGVQALAQLEAAIQFLRERRAMRSQVLVPVLTPMVLPRQQKPLSGSLLRLVSLAKNKVREISIENLAFERLTLAMALGRLREYATRIKKFFLHEVSGQSWQEQGVVFAAMLEAVRLGELNATQHEAFAEIELERQD